MKPTLQTCFSERPRDDKRNDVGKLCGFIEETHSFAGVLPERGIADNNPWGDILRWNKFQQEVPRSDFLMSWVDVDTYAPLWRQKFKKSAVSRRWLKKMGCVAV